MSVILLGSRVLGVPVPPPAPTPEPTTTLHLDLKIDLTTGKVTGTVK